MADLRYKREFSTNGYRQDPPPIDTFDRVNSKNIAIPRNGVVVVSWVSPMTDSQREQWRINMLRKEKHRRAVWKWKLWRERRRDNCLLHALNRLRGFSQDDNG
jgi:hypothetical protein